MNIFAHRGWIEEYPENSFLAIQTAFERGVGVELDIRINKDGDFVLIHDRNLERIFGKNIDISEVKNGELSEYRYPDFPKQTLCRFFEVAQIASQYPQSRIAIHLKYDDQTDDAMRLLAHYFETFDLFQMAFVFDLTMKNAQLLRGINKEIPIGFIVSEYKFEPTVYTWEEIKNQKSLYDIVWAAEYKNLYSREFIREVKKSGKKFYAVSPDLHKSLNHPLAYEGFETTWSELIDGGVDGICTDYPNRLLLFKK